MPKDSPLFEFRDVTLDIDGRRCLADFSCTAHRGEFIILKGDTGSGKTLVLELLCGLREPTAGDVIVAGDRINDFNAVERRSLRRSMGLMPQNALLLEDRTVLDNVLLPAVVADESLNEARERALIALEKCGLADVAHAFPVMLSTGQRQLAMLARAVVNRPVLILADEPAAHLDTHNAQTLINLLAAFARAGVTVVVASHQDCRPNDIEARVVTLETAA